jgi:hypothetical protein
MASVTRKVRPRVAAPGRNGISRNSYDRFSVPSAGVDPDNRTAAARTILNEVTGTAPSRLEGPLTVGALAASPRRASSACR